MKTSLLVFLFIAPLLCFGAVVGQIDTFDAGTANWTVAAGPAGGVHPQPPTTLPGGQGGAADMFLRLISVGGAGAGSRLTAMNLEQWAGDYTAAGIAGIAMDVRNTGTTDLSLRLAFENIGATGPTDVAVSTNAIMLAAGSDWTSVFFPITEPFLTNLGPGTVAAALAGADVLRIYSSETAVFPPAPIVGTLDIDNIAAAVPEPTTLLLTGAGFAAVALAVVRRGN